jgi:predicted MFS family arabinose efflux permease
MTGLYLVSAVFIYRMPLTGKTALAGEGVLSDIKEGLNYVRHEATILAILLFSILSVVLAMPYVHLMPVFIEDILEVGASEMGVLMSASGIGAVIGSLILAWFIIRNQFPLLRYSSARFCLLQVLVFILAPACFCGIRSIRASGTR